MPTWINGQITDEPSIGPTDHGFTVGDGCFDVIKTVDGVPFTQTRHLDRLAWCARRMRLPEPDLAQVEIAIKELMDACADEGDVSGVGRLRITYTAGPSPLGSDRGNGPATLAVSWSGSKLADPLREPTTKIATVPWHRNENGVMAGVKTTSYAENVLCLDEAHRRGASEAVLANTAGQLCEGTGSNIFVVVDGELLTPPLSSGCLAGVTRALVLEWTDAREADLPYDVLANADEVFLTSVTRDVQAVTEIDLDALRGVEVSPEGTVPISGNVRTLDAGPITAQTAQIFAERSLENVNP